ncbi:ABC transporter permease [Aneurinibacillus tyrosinisolvens]|uniref:ABC transporter permease n=1 Tax=Aneurinibacillus tyrosinisolvens TaxID=1443435 RepID=UPI00069A4E2F|nr:ABC transporter permease [Aneurinibacillus tyrosinisolvens]
MIETEKRVEVPISRVPSPYQLSKIPGLQWLLLLIPLAYIVFLMVFSMFGLFKLSIFDKNGFTLEYLSHIFLETVYLQVLWLTLKVSFIVTLMALIVSYPVAYLLVNTESSTWKKIIFAAVLIPFWISLLVRTFAWTIILQEQGVINKFLMAIGLIDQPIPLLYNTTGVVIGMTHVLIPYMVLSLYSVMEGIDKRLIQASQGMGAKPWKSFVQIFFPLSLPGVLSGSLLVFILAMGYFITPALLGGSKNMMISMLIQNNVSTTLNWNLASALALVLFVVTLLLLFLSYLLTRNNPVLKELN